MDSASVYPCPACGFFTMGEPPGSYEICSVCDWEDDHVQLKHPRMGGGANKASLVEAQAAALRQFPIETRLAKGFERDPAWRSLGEAEEVASAAPRSGTEYFESAASDDDVGYYWRK